MKLSKQARRTMAAQVYSARQYPQWEQRLAPVAGTPAAPAMYRVVEYCHVYDGRDAIAGSVGQTVATCFTEAGAAVALARLEREERNPDAWFAVRCPAGLPIIPRSPAERQRVEAARQAYLSENRNTIPF